MSKATLAILAGLLFLIIGVAAAVFFAHGWRLDTTKKNFFPTGILVATSDPDGAEVLIDGKLKTATNNTINLPAGNYTVRFNKEGFTPWEKRMGIKKEEVYKTNAFLFPSLPSLSPLTFSGATSPLISPDGTKVALKVATESSRLNGAGIWVLDLGKSFLPGFLSSPDLRLIYRSTASTPLLASNLLWSADSKQILAFSGSLATPSAAYLLETDRLNLALVDIAPRLPLVLEEWESYKKDRLEAKLSKLPAPLRPILATGSGALSFSPDETKILYLATASASLPPFLTSYLPGTNPTPQVRTLKPDNLYVYDLKEDKNYLIENCKLKIVNCRWFPSSRHLLFVSAKEIAVADYDGTNKAVLFSGPFNPSAVFPFPNWGKIVILTNLGNAEGKENLYTINLR